MPAAWSLCRGRALGAQGLGLIGQQGPPPQGKQWTATVLPAHVGDRQWGRGMSEPAQNSRLQMEAGENSLCRWWSWLPGPSRVAVGRPWAEMDMGAEQGWSAGGQVLEPWAGRYEGESSILAFYGLFWNHVHGACSTSCCLTPARSSGPSARTLLNPQLLVGPRRTSDPVCPQPQEQSLSPMWLQRCGLVLP